MVHWSVGYGLIAAIGMALLIPLSRLPLVGGVIPVYRFSGAREMSQYAQAAIDALRTHSGATPEKQPFVVGSRYTQTALLAFYLPGHPSVYCAMHQLGERRTSYDDFVDTNLGDPALVGRPVVLVGKLSPQTWGTALDVGDIAEFHKAKRYSILTGSRYAGIVHPPSAP